MRLTEVLLARAVCRLDVFRSTLRRQPGGQVFRAFNFLHMPFFEHALGPALFADHVGPRLDGFAVGLLRGLTQAALGTEPHAAAPSGKIVITHKLSVSFPMDVYVLHQAHRD
jgi:hypothetical protein